MSTPAIIYLILTAVGLLGTAYMHGKPRDNYNFWSVLISTILSMGLLVWGGFFK